MSKINNKFITNDGRKLKKDEWKDLYFLVAIWNLFKQNCLYKQNWLCFILSKISSFVFQRYKLSYVAKNFLGFKFTVLKWPFCLKFCDNWGIDLIGIDLINPYFITDNLNGLLRDFSMTLNKYRSLRLFIWVTLCMFSCIYNYNNN